MEALWRFMKFFFILLYRTPWKRNVAQPPSVLFHSFLIFWTPRLKAGTNTFRWCYLLQRSSRGVLTGKHTRSPSINILHIIEYSQIICLELSYSVEHILFGLNGLKMFWLWLKNSCSTAMSGQLPECSQILRNVWA